MPVDYSIYPPDWKTERVPRILHRANNCCENCGVKNHTIGYWYGSRFVSNGEAVKRYFKMRNEEGFSKKQSLRLANMGLKIKLIEIVLTVCHLDRDPENWNVEDSRLKAVCQKCHLNYDQEDNVQKRRYGKNYKKNQLPLLTKAGIL